MPFVSQAFNLHNALCGEPRQLLTSKPSYIPSRSRAKLLLTHLDYSPESYKVFIYQDFQSFLIPHLSTEKLRPLSERDDGRNVDVDGYFK